MGVRPALIVAVMVAVPALLGAVPCRVLTEEHRRRDVRLFERWASARHTLTREEYERRRAKLMTRLHGCDHSTHHEGERSLDAAASAQWNETEPADPWRCMPDPTHRKASVDANRWERMCSADFPQHEPWVFDDPFVIEPEGGYHGIRDVATMFAGRRLAVIGDSISRQWVDGIKCEAEREDGLAAAATSFEPFRASGCDVAFSVLRAGVDSASEAQDDHMQLLYCKQDLYTSAVVQPVLDHVDYVIVNFGLHYHDMGVYRHDMTELARHLTRWVAHGGHASFRETSAQHFMGAAGTGDYDARDAFRAENKVEGCGCTPIRAKDKRLNPNDKNSIVGDILARYPRITVVPFFNLTRPRYNMHFEAEMSLRDRLRACDCTHFCYSPPFWQRLNHDWYTAIKSKSP